MKRLDAYQGCLIGGAVGDALGYAVEFLTRDEIVGRYGPEGIVEYDLHQGKALISDDTQMTLFTANGLLLGITRGKMRGIMGTFQSYVWFCYKDWYRTQTETFPPQDNFAYAWLMRHPELYARRAPGNTCLSALSREEPGSIAEPCNDSKGCGGIMRIAPVALYMPGSEFVHCTQDETDMIAAEVAALTHGHPLGYIPAAMCAHIISLAAQETERLLEDIVKDAMQATRRLFEDNPYTQDLMSLVRRALELAHADTDDVAAIAELGEGWVAEETLAIAVYCAVKYADDFEKAIITSVNHSGDSDSTGAVTGNILGAYRGLKAIPEKFITNLELKDLIVEVAQDLYDDCLMEDYSDYKDPVWENKYIYTSLDASL